MGNNLITEVDNLNKNILVLDTRLNGNGDKYGALCASWPSCNPEEIIDLIQDLFRHSRNVMIFNLTDSQDRHIEICKLCDRCIVNKLLTSFLQDIDSNVVKILRVRKY